MTKRYRITFINHGKKIYYIKDLEIKEKKALQETIKVTESEHAKFLELAKHNNQTKGNFLIDQAIKFITTNDKKEVIKIAADYIREKIPRPKSISMNLTRTQHKMIREIAEPAKQRPSICIYILANHYINLLNSQES